MTTDPDTVLRDTRRLHRLRALVGGPLEAAGHAVRWHNLPHEGYSYCHCINRGCYALWILSNRDGKLTDTPIVGPGLCQGRSRRKS
jgi:hypothetical protein